LVSLVSEYHAFFATKKYSVAKALLFMGRYAKMEGPPLRVVAEEIRQFEGAEIIKVSGNSRIDKEILKQKRIEKVFPIGKNLFLQFDQFLMRIHFLMFGSYRINHDKAGVEPRLSLEFANGLLNFYNTSITVISSPDLRSLYDEEVDIMSDKWNIEKTVGLALQSPDEQVCDALLDQKVFAGVGNIIKNEALFMSKIHPLSKIGKLSKQQMTLLATSARQFSILFYETVKRQQSLRSQLSVYGKSNCPECGERVKKKKTGKLKRISYFCESTQQLYE